MSEGESRQQPMPPPGGPPPGGSLRYRMLFSAGLVLVLVLGIMGLVLDNANRLTAEQRVAERLQLHIYAFLAATEEGYENGQFTITLPQQLQEPLFNQLATGLYGLVYLEFSAEVWRSQSALDLVFEPRELEVLLAASDPGTARFGQLPATSQHGGLFYLVYPVIWQFGSDRLAIQFVVLEHTAPFLNEVRAFRTNLWGWLIGGVLVLVAIQAVIMNWGLSPITRLEKDLKAIEEGSEDYLRGSYPREISGVTGHFNQLLSTERRQREQYRTTLADLAHSLKTPLAILKTEAESAEHAASPALSEQVDRMNEIVSYQLERAVSSSSALVRNKTLVSPLVDKLVGALRRVYADRDIGFDLDVASVELPVEERDLMEMLGNLLDNACKYGGGRVRISTVSDEQGGELALIVEDNGPGIDAAHREAVLQRGARLDTREAGQGIGLAVVAEIVDRYGGEISIGESSSLGGARIAVRFS